MLRRRAFAAFATANYKHIGLLIGGGLQPSPDFLNAAPSQPSVRLSMRKPHEVCSTKLHRKFGVRAAVEDTKAPDEEDNAGTCLA